VDLFDLKIVVAVTSEINIVADVYGVDVSKYFSPAVYIVNAIELTHPNKVGLVSPE